MGKLTSQLVVSLLDRTGPGSRSVVRNVQTMKAATGGLGSSLDRTTQTLRRQSRTMRAFRTLGGGGGNMAGLGATALAGGFLASEYKYQEAMNRTQAILNVTNEKAFKPHRDLVVDLAKRYPTTSAEVAKGASELAMAGMNIKQVNEVLEATVQGSMASGESIKTVGMGVTDVVMGLGQALTKGNFLKINNVLAAAATSYAQDYRQFLDGLAKTAPLARMLGLPVEKLSGVLGILADAGFKGAKGGTAFRTSMINMAAPTKKANAFLQQYGIDLAKFQKKVDTFQLGGKAGAKSLSQFVADTLDIDSRGLNLDKVLLPLLSNKGLLKNIPELKRQLGRRIADALNIKDPQNSKMIGQAVNRFVSAGFKQLDVMALMRELAGKGFDENTPAMKELFGKRFVAQMAAVLNSLKTGTFDQKFDEIFAPRIEGAVQRFAKILMKGLPGALKRLGGAFDGFARSLASSGAIDTVVGVFERLTRGINSLSQTNPGALKGLTLSLLTLGAIAPIGFALQGIGAGITFLAGAAAIAGPAVMTLARALTLTSVAGVAGSILAPISVALAGIASKARIASASMTLLYGVGGAKAVALAATWSAAKGIFMGAITAMLVPIRLLKVALIATPIGGLVAGFTWIYNNASGLGVMIKSIGEGFTDSLGPAGPVIAKVANSLKYIVGSIGDMLGPLEVNKEQWRNWGRSVGEALAWPVRQIAKIIDGMRWLMASLTDSKLGRWVGRRMGVDAEALSAKMWQPEDKKRRFAYSEKHGPHAGLSTPAQTSGIKTATAAPGGGSKTNTPGALAEINKVKAAATAVPGAVRSAMSQATGIVSAVDMTGQGRRLMASLAAGIRSGTSEVVSAMRDATQRVKNHVPNSPAKEGPLRGIHRHGLMSEIARGIRTDKSAVAAMNDNAAQLNRAANQNFQPLRAAAASGGAGVGGQARFGASGAAHGDISVVVTVAQTNANPRQIGDEVGRAVRNSVREHYSDGGI